MTNYSDKKASYEVSSILAKNGKAYSDWETVKKCAIKMALAFGDTKMAKKFETVPLSHQTVARRVMELNDHEPSKIKVIVQQCKYFFLALNESVDICDVNQLLLFTCTFDKNFTVYENLLQASVPSQVCTCARAHK